MCEACLGIRDPHSRSGSHLQVLHAAERAERAERTQQEAPTAFQVDFSLPGSGRGPWLGGKHQAPAPAPAQVYLQLLTLQLFLPSVGLPIFHLMYLLCLISISSSTWPGLNLCTAAHDLRQSQ